LGGWWIVRQTGLAVLESGIDVNEFRRIPTATSRSARSPLRTLFLLMGSFPPGKPTHNWDSEVKACS
jgi:hypothetical protein